MADDDEFETPSFSVPEPEAPPAALLDAYQPAADLPAGGEPVWEVKWSFGPRQPELMAQYEALSQIDLTARLLNQPDGPDKDHMLQAWLDREYLNLSMTPDAQDRRDIALAIRAKANRYAAYLRERGAALPVETPMATPADDFEIVFDDDVLDTTEAPEGAPVYLFADGAHVMWNLTDGSELSGHVRSTPMPAAADDPDGGLLYTIKCDPQYELAPGGVPLGRIEHVGEAYLALVDDNPEQTAEGAQEAEIEAAAEISVEEPEAEAAPEPAEEEAPAPAAEVAPMPNPEPAKPGKVMATSTKYKYDAAAEPFVPGQATINVRLMIEPVAPDGTRRVVVSLASHDLPPHLHVSQFNDLLCQSIPQLVANYEQTLPERAQEVTTKGASKTRRDGKTPTSSVAAKPKPEPKFGQSGHLSAAAPAAAPAAAIRPAPKPAPKVSKAAAKKAAAKHAKTAKAPTKGGQISFD